MSPPKLLLGNLVHIRRACQTECIRNRSGAVWPQVEHLPVPARRVVERPLGDVGDCASSESSSRHCAWRKRTPVVVRVQIVDEADPHARGQLGELDLAGARVQKGVHDVLEAVADEVVKDKRNLRKVRGAHLGACLVVSGGT